MGFPEFKTLSVPEKGLKDHRWFIFYLVVFSSYIGTIVCLIYFTKSTPADRFGYAATLSTTALYAFLSVTLGELLAKTGQVINEHRYLDTRYNNSASKLLRKLCLLGGLRYLVVTFTCVLCLVTIHFGYTEGSAILRDVFMAQWFLLLSWVVFRGALLPLLCLDGESPVEAPILGETRILNCAHGLAWSYYYGYLKLILPGLQQRITDSKWWGSEKGKMVAKLFILLPESCFTPPTITHEDSNIQHVGVTEPVLANRAGAVRRPYTNQVYRVETPADGKGYFCLVEYATPLLSLYEMSHSSESGLTQGQMKEQMHTFYRTLVKILKKAPYGDSIVLLPYKEKDEHNQKTDLSTFLASEIEEEYQLWGTEKTY